jgi:hypothetical protein
MYASVTYTTITTTVYPFISSFKMSFAYIQMYMHTCICNVQPKLTLLWSKAIDILSMGKAIDILQGDQIGLIFSYYVIIYYGYFL